jgi:hypothetical protein
VMTISPHRHGKKMYTYEYNGIDCFCWQMLTGFCANSMIKNQSINDSNQSDWHFHSFIILKLLI